MRMKRSLLISPWQVVFLLLVSHVSLVCADTFKSHCRDRSPQVVVEPEGCSGPIPEIVTTALSSLGHDIQWLHAPWARSLIEAEHGVVDLLFRHSMTEEREAFLHAVRYGNVERRLVYMISPKIQEDISSKDDLEKFVIGSLRGSLYSEELAQNTKLERLYFGSHQQIVKMLTMGRIDVAPTSSSHKEELYRAIPGAREASYSSSFLAGRYISIPKKSPMAKHFPALEKVIRNMVIVGDIDRIFHKYNLTPPIQE